MKLMRFALPILCLAGVAATANAQINLDLRARIDLSSTAGTTGIGSNPSAVVWNGTDAFVAGYNSSGATASVRIVRVSNALTAPTIGTPFGATSSPNSRGFSSLALSGNSVIASLDSGAGNANSLQSFDIATGNRNWGIGDPSPAAADSNRRGYGATIDPGWGGSANRAAGAGIAFMNLGSGRRGLVNASNGSYVTGQTFAAGPIINFATTSTTWRDAAFNPATGDLYTRESNRIGFIARTGDAAFAGPMTVISPAAFLSASAVDNQNLAFVNSALAGNFLIANNRNDAGPGQSFNTVVRGLTTGGAFTTLNFLENGAPAVFASGNGAYDFSYDAATETLAVTDFSNRQLYIFQIPTPGAAALLGLGGLVAMRRRRA